jgi:hypothetical protein
VIGNQIDLGPQTAVRKYICFQLSLHKVDRLFHQVGFIDPAPKQDALIATTILVVKLFVCIEYYTTINAAVLLFRVIQVV